MKNIDYIKSLSIEELAEVLVKKDIYDDSYCDNYDEWVESYEIVYVDMDGIWYYQEEDCIRANVEWLLKEHSN